MTYLSADPNTEFLLTVLREMSAHSAKVLEAGSVGDDLATRAAIDQIRQLRAEMHGIGQNTKKQVDDAPTPIKAELVKLLAKINQSDAFISAWCTRFNGLMTQEQLLLSPEGRQALIDQLMPATWNWAVDILTAHDTTDPALIKAAQERGQIRIVVFCASKPAKEEMIPAVYYLIDKKEAHAYFQTLDFSEPQRSVNFNSAPTQGSETGRDGAAIYDEFHAEFTRAWNNYLVNKNTIRFFGKRWLLQGLDNLPSIAEHATFSSLIGKFVNLPMVIISPGPSLDKNVHLLKQLKGKALLMAPAQSALALSRVGLVPDVLVVADPADLLYMVDGFPMDQVGALLLGVACHPAFYQRYKGKIITFNVNAGIDTWISDIFHDTAHVGSGGSVSTALFTMGLYLKCNPIVLVGQDLALTNGQQYASDSADGQMRIKFDEEKETFSYENVSPGYENLYTSAGSTSIGFTDRALLLPGYYGGMVQTKADYVMFHSEFENHAETENAKEAPIRLVNCTEGGAFIKGFQHIPLSELIEEINDSAQAITEIESSLKTIQTAVDVAGRRKLLFQRLQHAKDALEKSYQLALRCAKMAMQVQKNTVKIGALTKIENELAKAIQGSAFIALANQAEITNAIHLGLRAKTIPKSLAASKILYTLVIREVPKLLPLVNKAMLMLNQAHAH
ncbi:MAG: 6-hydroxymethylpterin diphosphokinase MptE-like protein [Burkholderiaceae bacterium]